MMKVELWTNDGSDKYYITLEGKSPGGAGVWRYVGQRDLNEMHREFSAPAYAEDFDKAKVLQDLQDSAKGYFVWEQPERISHT